MSAFKLTYGIVSTLGNARDLLTLTVIPACKHHMETVDASDAKNELLQPHVCVRGDGVYANPLCLGLLFFHLPIRIILILVYLVSTKLIHKV